MVRVIGHQLRDPQELLEDKFGFGAPKHLGDARCDSLANENLKPCASVRNLGPADIVKRGLDQRVRLVGCNQLPQNLDKGLVTLSTSARVSDNSE